LDDFVTFYEQRFGINFTDQEKSDLLAFLATLLPICAILH
jgi:hypothetical protein